MSLGGEGVAMRAPLEGPQPLQILPPCGRQKDIKMAVQAP